jgi:hypothetical protein
VKLTSGGVRAGLIAGCNGLLVAPAACGSLMGFDHGRQVQCLDTSDCDAGAVCEGYVCVAQCAAEFNCDSGLACVDDQCRVLADAGVDSAGPGEAAVDSGDAGVCANACQPHDVCLGSACHTGEQEPPFSSGDASVVVQTQTLVTCAQIRISVCGTLTALGIQFTDDPEAIFRLGFYDDLAGSPNNLLTETAEALAAGSEIDPPVLPVVSVGCGTEPIPYWICFASYADIAMVSARPDIIVPWATDYSPGGAPGFVDGGFADHWSGTDQFTHPQPMIYPWVAQ